jgi:hypothetical protein
VHLFHHRRGEEDEQAASPERLRPARGMVVGIGLSLVMWCIFATVWLILR